MTVLLVTVLLITSFPGVDARGKKKKKAGGGGSSGPTCESLGLDCSATCCTGSECADTKLDCATNFRRPYSELYIGFGTIIGITVSFSLMVAIGDFCLNQKFFQHYDEASDSYVGGCSVCDAFSCLVTCGLIYRQRESQKSSDGSIGIPVDFRKRFEASMDQERKLLEAMARGETKRTKQAKNLSNYLSQDAR